MSLFLHLQRIKPKIALSNARSITRQPYPVYSCLQRLHYSTTRPDLPTEEQQQSPLVTLPLPNPSRPTFKPSSDSLNAYEASSESLAIPPSLDIPPAVDPLLAYIATHIMRHGKRHIAARRVSRILLHIYAFTRSPPLPILRQAIELAAPSIRVISHKKGGKVTQKPVPLSEKRRTFYAIKWILDAAGGKKKEMTEINKRKLQVYPSGGQTVEERVARVVVNIVKAPDSKSNSVLKRKAGLHESNVVVPRRTH
ncbi:hypothetical protein Clacol_001991 [Clathrus columnatus]|uniref:Small ribosomal subunit protein uS7 domain-containing protein n=1 Tax=Clathrus columnatus TaxID=1419009 RepID=A0AAV4ZZJ1_9AGAM|nr:hypothetical protein Clacol_001991 [Clathrus columnatus]